MSCLPRPKLFRRRRREKQARSFFHHVGRFFTAFFSCFPCITHPDVVQTLSSYSIVSNKSYLQNGEGDSNQESYEVKREYEWVIGTSKRSDSLLEAISERSLVAGDVQKENGYVDQSIMIGNRSDKSRSETRVLGPAPEVLNCYAHMENPLHGRMKTRIALMAGDNRSDRGEGGRFNGGTRCGTPFTVPLKQLSFNKMAEKPIIRDAESTMEMKHEKMVAENRMKRPDMQLGRKGSEEMVFCGEDDDCEIEELQEVICITNNVTENDHDFDAEFDLTVQGVGCYTPQIPLDAPKNVPQSTLISAPQQTVGNQIMSAKANKEIDNILLGNHKWYEDIRYTVNGITCGESKKRKKGKKGKKNKKGNKEDKNEYKETILEAFPPMPMTKFGAQIGTWINNEKTNQEMKGQVDKKEKSKGWKKEKKKKNKNKEIIVDENRQKEEKLPMCGDKDTNRNLDEENHRKERFWNCINNIDAKLSEDMGIESDGFANDKIKNDTNTEKNKKKSKKMKNKNKEEKKKTVSEKIGEALSGLLNESQDGKNKDSGKKNEQKTKKVNDAAATEHLQAQEDEYGGRKCKSDEIEDDFYHPRHRPTSKERPPGRGNPNKYGLLLIETPITPPEIVPNETVGHCCRYCDYLEKLHRRNLEKMTPFERKLANEEERKMKKEQINCKRRLKTNYQEDQLLQKQNAVSRITEIMQKSRKKKGKSETKRLIFVQPVNQFDYYDDDFMEVRLFLSCF